jgi:hypothetical protein
MPWWNPCVFREILSHIIGAFAQNMRRKVKKFRFWFAIINEWPNHTKTLSFSIKKSIYKANQDSSIEDVRSYRKRSYNFFR